VVFTVRMGFLDGMESVMSDPIPTTQWRCSSPSKIPWNFHPIIDSPPDGSLIENMWDVTLSWGERPQMQDFRDSASEGFKRE